MERKVTIEERIPIVVNERVPRGMALVGYDAHGKLVYMVNLDKAKEVTGKRVV